MFDSHFANAFVHLGWLRQLAKLFGSKIVQSSITLLRVDLGLCLTDLLLGDDRLGLNLL